MDAFLTGHQDPKEIFDPSYEFQFYISPIFFVGGFYRSLPKASVAPTLCLINHPTRKNRPTFATTRDSHASLLNCGG
jgi:hypothetical protein